MRFPLACILTSSVLAIASRPPVNDAVQLDILPAYSELVCGGQSSVGPLVGALNNVVHADGSAEVLFIPTASGELFARLHTVQTVVVEDIRLQVGSGPAPLRAVTLQDLTLWLDADSQARVPDGHFDFQGFAEVVSGNLTVDVLGHGVSQLDLAGTDASFVIRQSRWVTGGASSALTLELPVEIELELGDFGIAQNLTVDLEGRLLARRVIPLPQTYCTASVNSLGCAAQIGAVGSASATMGSGFTIGASNLRSHAAGLLFYGVNGRTQLPFQGGTLCVAPPLTRTPMQASGGSGPVGQNCSGQYALDFNTWISEQSVLSPVRVPATTVDCQWWSRDPNVSSTTVLSNALEFTIGL